MTVATAVSGDGAHEDTKDRTKSPSSAPSSLDLFTAHFILNHPKVRGKSPAEISQLIEV